MRFTDTFLEEIRQRLSITQVVGEYVVWDKRKSQPGRGDMWACCPFHGEKTPSFHADDRKGIYHCFGCGVTGDHFRISTELGGLSFPEAVEKLAGQAGVPMPARDEREEQRDRERKTLYDVMELATGYFEAALQHNIGAQARGYLNERAVSPKEQVTFRIGYAPDSRNGLKEHLAANGVSAEQMNAAGLVISGENISVPYDRFRNRVMFPIKDFRGRIIAFGGRALSPDVPAKYLNSPETDLFKKRHTLYNGDIARKAAFDGKPVVVVEGYLDVIAAARAGFTGTVAPLGTALTEEHVNLLWRMSDIPVLCFDGDSAGQRAMARTLEIVLPLLSPGKSVRVATLPEGMDPDDLIAKSGAGAFEELVAGARSLVESVWALETMGGLPETPEGRAALEQSLRGRVTVINDQTVRRHYQQDMDERIKSLFQPKARSYGGNQNNNRRGGQSWGQNRGGGFGNSGFGGGGQNWRGPSPKRVVSDSLRNSQMMRGRLGHTVSPREAVILMALINHPRLAEDYMERLVALDFETPDARTLLSHIIDMASVHDENGEQSLAAKLSTQGYAPLLGQMNDVLKRQGIWQWTAEIALADAETGLNHALALHYKSVQLNRELKAAELALGHEPSEKSFERLKDIQNQIASVDGTEALIEGFGSLSGRASPGF